MDPLANTLPLAAARRTIATALAHAASLPVAGIAIAIGVSGGSVDEDTAIARHCRDRFQATFHLTR